MTEQQQAAMRQALEALRDAHDRARPDGTRLDYSREITALRQALALEKMAENERELGIQMVADEPVAIDGNTSDGYHTFNELYEFRKAYNAALFNEWAANDKCSVHKSWRHHDGELCFGGGWFIVVAVLPSGQISNHYEAKDWNLFAVPETHQALFEFDGHTGDDVLARLKTYSPQPTDEPVARVVGYYAGRCVIEPLDRARVMPDNMALYAHHQPATPCPTCEALARTVMMDQTGAA